MAKFTFSFDGETSVVKMDYYVAEDEFSKMEVITKFEHFLKGCGVELDGKLKIVNQEYDDIFIDLPEDWSKYQTTPTYESPFSAVMNDHMNFTSAYPDVMSVDLSDLEKPVCGAACGSTRIKCGCVK